MKVFHKIEEESISQTNNEEFDEKCCGQKCGTHQNGEAKKPQLSQQRVQVQT